jgi:hypothetical protein
MRCTTLRQAQKGLCLLPFPLLIALNARNPIGT